MSDALTVKVLPSVSKRTLSFAVLPKYTPISSVSGSSAEYTFIKHEKKIAISKKIV